MFRREGRGGEVSECLRLRSLAVPPVTGPSGYKVTESSEVRRREKRLKWATLELPWLPWESRGRTGQYLLNFYGVPVPTLGGGGGTLK